MEVRKSRAAFQGKGWSRESSRTTSMQHWQRDNNAAATGAEDLSSGRFSSCEFE